MSYAKSLQNALNDKNTELFNRLSLIESAAKSVLTYTTSKFPYYTPHDFSHSKNVEENLNWLIPDDIKTKLSDQEIFFLIISSWLHDWGLVASKEDNEENVRRDHHIRTEENFEKHYALVHLSFSEARIIGRICRGHREENLHSKEYQDSFIGSGVVIRVSFLASLLRLADECDITANRTPEIIYFSIKPEGASDLEFLKHLSIQGIGIPDQNPYKIVLTCVAKSPKGVEVIEQVKGKIQKQLESVKTILATNGIILEIVETHIDTRGFINKPIAFELDRRAIVNLLIGQALYSRPDVAIRELLQNSIDTCNYRLAIENNYKPEIKIEFDKNHITFKDNGMGMNFEDALEHFSKKGSSFYSSDFFKDAVKGKKIEPIGKFGIGVLSSFIIADKMIVNTKKSNCSPCKFSIADFADGWTYEQGGREEQGTDIILYLNETGLQVDVLASFFHYAKSVRFPILITNKDTGESQILSQKWDNTIPEILEELRDIEKERFLHEEPEIIFDEDFYDFEIKIYFYDNFFFRENNCFVLNQGIYIGDFDLFPAYTKEYLVLINLKSDILDLTVSRDDFVRNEKFNIFLDKLYDSVLSLIEKHNEKENFNKSDFEKCENHSLFLDRFFLDQISCPKSSPKSALSLKIIKLQKFISLTTEGTSIKKFDEIIEGKITKIFHYRVQKSQYEQNIEIAIQLFTQLLKPNEVVIFDLGPDLSYSDTEECCCFCDLAYTKGVECIECCDLSSSLSYYDFEEINSSLKCLLPSDSYFSKMPDLLRGVVVQIKSFEFMPPPDSDYIEEEYYYHLVAKHLLSDEQEFANYYDLQLDLDLKNSVIEVEGKFVYDADDFFIAFLISKADQISSDPVLQKMCERYFKFLAISYLSYPILMDTRLEGNIITLIEKMLAESLGFQGEYLEMQKRAGPLALIYNMD